MGITAVFLCLQRSEVFHSWPQSTASLESFSLCFRGEEGKETFKFLMENGAKYNSQYVRVLFSPNEKLFMWIIA